RPRAGSGRRGRGHAPRRARAPRPRLRPPPGGEPPHRVLHHPRLRHGRARPGVAYDPWAGIIKPEVDEDGFTYLPEHASIGIHAGPLFGALGILAGIIRARATGEGCRMEIAQSG